MENALEGIFTRAIYEELNEKFNRYFDLSKESCVKFLKELLVCKPFLFILRTASSLVKVDYFALRFLLDGYFFK